MGAHTSVKMLNSCNGGSRLPKSAGARVVSYGCRHMLGLIRQVTHAPECAAARSAMDLLGYETQLQLSSQCNLVQ